MLKNPTHYGGKGRHRDREDELFKGKDKILECEGPAAEPASQTRDLLTKLSYKMQGESRGATCHLSAMRGGTWESACPSNCNVCP